MNQRFHTGDWVIYRKTKFSSKPGPRAQDIAPARNGDQYSYTIDKYWIVSEVRSDGSLVLLTRRGKQHVLSADVPTLKRANLFQRWWHRGRFEAVAQQPKSDASTEAAVQAAAE